MATNQRNLLKKATFWSLCCLLFSGPISAQKVYPAYGLNDFVETADPETYDSKQWDDLSSGLHAAWGSIDTLYKKVNVPANKIKQTKAVVWKGEKVNFIALAYTKNEIKDVKCVTRYIFHHSGGKCQIELCPIHTLRQVQNFRRNIGLCRSNAA